MDFGVHPGQSPGMNSKAPPNFSDPMASTARCAIEPSSVDLGQELAELRSLLLEKDRQLQEQTLVIQELERIIANLEFQVRELQSTVQTLDLDLATLKKAVDTPKEALAALERAHALASQELQATQEALKKARERRFASKSEKNRRFEKPKPELSPEEVKKATEETNKKRSQTRAANQDTSHLARQEFFVEAPATICGKDGCQETMCAWPDSQSEKFSILRLVPSHFEEEVYHLQKRQCPIHKDHIVRAAPPARPLEGKSKLSAEALAQLVCNKFWLHLPLHRQLKMFRRAGYSMSQASLVRYVQNIAEHLRPLELHQLDAIKASELTLADETVLKCLDKRPRPQLESTPEKEIDLQEAEAQRREIAIDRTRPPDQRAFPVDARKTVPGISYLWVFVDPITERTAFYFSVSRAGETPRLVLGRSKGILLTDGYTGYNAVTVNGERTQAYCNVHNRRNYYELSKDLPERKFVLEIYEELYKIENKAWLAGIVGSEAHLKLRQAESAPLMTKLKDYLDKLKLLPKDPLEAARQYTLNHWEGLTLFLTNPKVPLDNNLSERILCTVAMGRNNWRHVGNIWSGEALATFLTIISECERVEVDPETYIAQMLMVPGAKLRENPEAYAPEAWKTSEAALEASKPGRRIPLFGPEVVVRPISVEPRLESDPPRTAG